MLTVGYVALSFVASPCHKAYKHQSQCAMFEPRRARLLPRRRYYHRLGRGAAIGATIIAMSLVVGMAGYHVFENMSWLDAFVNASMILSGMGPVGELHTNAGKFFAGCYAIFSGVAFLTSIGVVFAPIFHRFIHKFHIETESESKKD